MGWLGRDGAHARRGERAHGIRIAPRLGEFRVAQQRQDETGAECIARPGGVDRFDRPGRNVTALSGLAPDETTVGPELGHGEPGLLPHDAIEHGLERDVAIEVGSIILAHEHDVGERHGGLEVAAQGIAVAQRRAHVWRRS